MEMNHECVTNVFDILMANRHKQNEIVVYANEEENSVLDENVDDVENEDMKREIKSFMNPFLFMMANRHRQNESVFKFTKEKDSILDNEELGQGINSKRYQSVGSSSKNDQISDDFEKDIGNNSVDKMNENRPNVSMGMKLKFSFPPLHDSTIGTKQSLFNDMEKIDIEEAFKEEILECGLKKSRMKSFKKGQRSRQHEMKSLEKNEDIIFGKDEIVNKKSDLIYDKSQTSITKYLLQSSKGNASIAETTKSKNVSVGLSHVDVKKDKTKGLDINTHARSNNYINHEERTRPKINMDVKEDRQLTTDLPHRSSSRTRALRQVRLSKEISPFRKLPLDSYNEVCVLQNENLEALPDAKEITHSRWNIDINEINIQSEKNEEPNVVTPTSLRRSMRMVKRPQLYDPTEEYKKSPKGYKKEGNMDLSKSKKVREDKKSLASSEDDEVWDIFKKTKSLKKSRSLKVKKKISKSTKSSSEDDYEVIFLDKKAITTESKACSDASKLAPLFQKKKKKKKVQEDPAKKKAREDFLFSESPIVEMKPLKDENEEGSYAPFPSVSHIRQKDDDSLWDLTEAEVRFTDVCLPTFDTGRMKWEKMYKLTTCPKIQLLKTPSLSVSDMFHILLSLDKEASALKIVSLFQEMMKCKREALTAYYKECSRNESNRGGNPKGEVKAKCGRKSLSLRRRKQTEAETTQAPVWDCWNPFSWNHLFAPQKSEWFIGNHEHLSEMRRWLLYWKENAEKGARDVQMGDTQSYAMDESDTNESAEGYCNTMLLIGQSGVGKTAAVYTLAQELGYKVLEINGSSKRTGREIMSQIAEATQSHTVSSNAPPLSFPQIDVKKSVKKRRRVEQEEGHSEASNANGCENSKLMALILIEDLDIVFEEVDEGFFSALNTLMSTSKRPIVLTLEQKSENILTKLRENYSVSRFTPPDPSAVARYLQIMCLADGTYVSFHDLKELVEFNQCDIRKSILDLQFWHISGFSQSKRSIVTNHMASTEDYGNDSLFKNIVLQTEVETPIAYGCCWKKCFVEKELLKTEAYSFQNQKPKLLRPPKYPLKEDDPLVKSTIAWHKFTFQMYEDEPPKNPISQNYLENSQMKPISHEERVSNDRCLSCLCATFNTFCDIDILEVGFLNSSKIETKLQSHFCSTFTGIEQPDDETCSLYSSLVNQSESLIGGLTTSSVSFARKEMAKYFSGSFDISEILPTLNRRQDEHNRHSRNEIWENIPLSVWQNRIGIHLDYIPFVREIARTDQLLEVIHNLKTRRLKRFCPNMKNLNFFLSTNELLSLCNDLQVS